MIKIFGDFEENSPHSDEYLLIGFSPSSIPLKQRWRNNGLSADFMADYLVTFFPATDDEPDSAHKQAEVRSAVSYIANELLENAMKFNHEKLGQAVKIELQVHPDCLVFLVTNTILEETQQKLEQFIAELHENDPADLYIQRLEDNAQEDTKSSGLGLLTMVNDYNAKLGWRFQEIGGYIRVTIRVQISI